MREQRIIKLIDNLAPPELHDAVWKETGLGSSWLFGHSSGTERGIPFWKMDLDDDPTVSRLWEHARPICEENAGCELSMLRQYANGHTFGQGGRLHEDDDTPGTYTLLYYPMPEWRDEWEGETIFQDGKGEVAAIVRPTPNRAILFDSRIPHAGRAPSRTFGGLRVSVAFKLRRREPGDA